MQDQCTWPPVAASLSAAPDWAVPADFGGEFRRAFLRRGTSSELAFAEGVSSPDSVQRSAKMARLEAVLLVADSALSTRRLAQLATLADAAEARTLIDRLNTCYDVADCAFRIERVAAGYQMLTRPEFAFWLDRIHNRQTELKLSPPAMETLAIVAYRQPLTRADIEAVRGVQCAEMLKQLLERGLVRIGGEEESLGRPYLYETTRKFLELFGLRSVDDLPMVERLRKRRGSESDSAAAAGPESAGPESTGPAGGDVSEETPARAPDEQSGGLSTAA